MLGLGLPLSLLSLNVNSRHPNHELYFFSFLFSENLTGAPYQHVRRSAFGLLFLVFIKNYQRYLTCLSVILTATRC